MITKTLTYRCDMKDCGTTIENVGVDDPFFDSSKPIPREFISIGTMLICNKHRVQIDGQEV